MDTLHNMDTGQYYNPFHDVTDCIQQPRTISFTHTFRVAVFYSTTTTNSVEIVIEVIKHYELHHKRVPSLVEQSIEL